MGRMAGMEKDVNKKAEVHPLWWLVYIGLVLVLLFILSTVQVLMNVRFRLGALWMGLIIAGCVWLARFICRRREPAPPPALRPVPDGPQSAAEPTSVTEPAEEKIAAETATENELVPEVPAEASEEEAAAADTPAQPLAAGHAVAGARSSRLGIAAVVLLAANLGMMCFMAFTLRELCRICRAEPYFGQLNRIERSLDGIDSELSRLDGCLERIREAIPSTHYADSSSDTEELGKIRQLLNEISGYVYDLEKHSQRLESLEDYLERIQEDTRSIQELLFSISFNSSRRR